MSAVLIPSFPMATDIPGLCLRRAERSDAERLRLWKNAHRTAFFFDQQISEDMQAAWFAGYLARADDHLFVLELHGRAVGCLGVRFDQGLGEIYNVILADLSLRRRGLMTAALQTLLDFASDASARIVVRVRRDNDALRFYQRNGFVVVAERDNSFELRLEARPARDSHGMVSDFDEQRPAGRAADLE
jgi:ribosomal protein S18 acetylase RimI-like enzyme